MNDITEQTPEVKTLADFGYVQQKEAAVFIGKSECWLWRMRREKGLHYYRIGGTIAYKRSDLIDFVEGCRK